LEELVPGSGPGDIVINSAFDRDSVIQFISACEGAEFSLTLSNVFEIELLCDEWSVFGTLIRQKVTEFIEHPLEIDQQQLCFRQQLHTKSKTSCTSHF
jgi:hypothetical protein